MQPNRQIHPHDPTGCRRCAPDGIGRPGIGHQGCQQNDCNEIAESQHRRHATDAEYAALPEGFVPADQICLVAVFMCGDHELDPICGPEDHRPAQPELPDPIEIECPKCGVDFGAPCIRPDGSARRGPHESRGQQQPLAELATRCTHAHRADCEGYGACACAPDDPVPARPTIGSRPELESADFLRALPLASH